MLPYLIFLGIAVPAIELFLLIQLSWYIGFWWTLGIILFTGVIGVLLWRWQGFGIIRRVQRELLTGVSPGTALLDGALIFFAGGLLLTPGVLTDLLGFVLLIPPTRALIRKAILAWFKRHFQVVDFTGNVQEFHFGQGFGPETGDEDEDVIDAEFREKQAD